MLLCKDLIKVYYDPITNMKVSALRGLDLLVNEGEIASIIGPSGAGKTTLIKILSGLERPSGGYIYIDNVNITELSEKELRQFRYEKMAIINQYVHQNLLSSLTVEKNILLPMKLRYLTREEARKETDRLLKLLHLERIRNNPVTRISGGEAVRTSIAVALAKKPKIILADEPTGQLDTANTNDIIKIFREVNEETNATIVVVTHDLRFRNAFKKSYVIRDGRLVGINVDIDRSELDFLLKPQESSLQSFIDSSQFVRLPDEVFVTGAFQHIVEFDIHPSRRFSVLFNPNEITREEIYELMKKTEAYQKPATTTENGKKKVSFSEVRAILEQEFKAPVDTKTIISVKNLHKAFHLGKRTHKVLKGISFDVQKGDFVVISGKSGAGKTTLMNVLSGVESADQGTIKIFDFDVTAAEKNEASDFRFHNISMISQVNNLFEQYTVKDNILIPSLFNSEHSQLSDTDILDIAKNCEIDHKLYQYAVELSAGEKQRASLAVALSRQTPIIFADEPTANLDSRLARNIITLLMDTAKKYNTTIVMSTHDLSLVRPGFRLIRLQDGKIIDDMRVTKDKLKEIIELYLNIAIEEE